MTAAGGVRPDPGARPHASAASEGASMRFGIIKPTPPPPGDTENGDKNGNEQPAESKIDAAGEKPDYAKIEAALGYQFKEIRWLERALTHRSVQAKGAKNDYERLEFLGD